MKETKVVAIAVLILMALVLIIMNSAPVEQMSNGIWLIGHLKGVPLSLLVILSLVIGFLGGFLIARRSAKR